MSWGEEDREPNEHTVICDKCKQKTESWNCLIEGGRTICDDCCTVEEKDERDRIHIIQEKAFDLEMERSNSRY